MDSDHLEDLQESITLTETVVSGCPKDHLERARYLHDHGVSL